MAFFGKKIPRPSFTALRFLLESFVAASGMGKELRGKSWENLGKDGEKNMGTTWLKWRFIINLYVL
jgi:hypothetical protein